MCSTRLPPNIHAARGVAIREFRGHWFADYLLYVDGKAAGVILKKEGVTLTGVETQSDKYKKGLPDALRGWRNPLPFAYQSTGIENRYTNGLDPHPALAPGVRLPQQMLAEWMIRQTTVLNIGGGKPDLTRNSHRERFLANLRTC